MLLLLLLLLLLLMIHHFAVVAVSSSRPQSPVGEEVYVAAHVSMDPPRAKACISASKSRVSTAHSSNRYSNHGAAESTSGDSTPSLDGPFVCRKDVHVPVRGDSVSTVVTGVHRGQPNSCSSSPGNVLSNDVVNWLPACTGKPRVSPLTKVFTDCCVDSLHPIVTGQGHLGQGSHRVSAGSAICQDVPIVDHTVSDLYPIVVEHGHMDRVSPGARFGSSSTSSVSRQRSNVSMHAVAAADVDVALHKHITGKDKCVSRMVTGDLGCGSQSAPLNVLPSNVANCFENVQCCSRVTNELVSHAKHGLASNSVTNSDIQPLWESHRPGVLGSPIDCNGVASNCVYTHSHFTTKQHAAVGGCSS